MIWYSWVVNKATLMGGNNWEGGTPEVASNDQVIGRSSVFFTQEKFSGIFVKIFTRQWKKYGESGSSRVKAVFSV